MSFFLLPNQERSPNVPAVNVHLALADRVLEAWRKGVAPAPFDVADPRTVNAFYNGAFGPDLGYFPGGERVLSELSHGVAPGALCRRLLAGARTEAERAFAHGWATHVLGDQLIHPLVGLGVGEVLTGRRDLFVSGKADQVTHIRVEIGLDAFFALRNPSFRERRLTPVFDTSSIAYLEDAYRSTYGLSVSRTILLRCHEGVSDVARIALPVIAAIGTGVFHRSLRRRARRVLSGAAEALRRRWGREPLSLATMTPFRPRPWLLRRVRAIETSFGERFLDLAEGDYAALPDRDMESGAPAYPSPPAEFLEGVSGPRAVVRDPLFPAVAPAAGVWTPGLRPLGVEG